MSRVHVPPNSAQEPTVARYARSRRLSAQSRYAD